MVLEQDKFLAESTSLEIRKVLSLLQAYSHGLAAGLLLKEGCCRVNHRTQFGACIYQAKKFNGNLTLLLPLLAVGDVQIHAGETRWPARLAFAAGQCPPMRRHPVDRAVWPDDAKLLVIVANIIPGYCPLHNPVNLIPLLWMNDREAGFVVNPLAFANTEHLAAMLVPVDFPRIESVFPRTQLRRIQCPLAVFRELAKLFVAFV